jgi:hypothetical protein
MECDARFQILDAGRRYGKTKIGAKKALKRVRAHNRWCGGWPRPTRSSSAATARCCASCRTACSRTRHLRTPRSTPAAVVVLRFKNGSRMEFYSAERPEGMLGEGVDFVVLDEAAIMPKQRLGADVPPDADGPPGLRADDLDATRAQLVLLRVAARPGR